MSKARHEFIRYGSRAWKSTKDSFLLAQNGLCAICKRKLTSPKLDHCHDTGMIRGVLCNGCNVMLGWYENNADALDRYLTHAALYSAKRTVPRSREDRGLAIDAARRARVSLDGEGEITAEVA